MTTAEQTYWDHFAKSLNDAERSAARVTVGYAGNAQVTDQLLEFYLTGKKTAGSSLVEDFITARDPLPEIGNYWIFLNSAGAPSAILQTKRVVTNKFLDVPVEIAIAEGEGDLSLEHWRKVHADIYEPSLETWGLQSINDATVITEFFRIVFK